MDKRLLTVLMAGGLIAAVNTSAFAEDTGKIEFSGHIVTDTCIIGVDGTGTDTVVTSAGAYPGNFDGGGIPDPTEDFQISLAKCDPAIASLNLRFDGDTTNGESLRLKNDPSDTSTAANVSITVTSNNGSSTDVVFNGPVPVSTTDVVNTDDEATPSTFNYTARMIQIDDGKSTAGKYRASASFTVFYH